MIGVFLFLVIALLVMTGIPIAGYYVETRCCFYEDGKHRCWHFSKWNVRGACGFEHHYCDRHEKQRLA